MSGFDGTGPQGYGQRTGGGFGRCEPNAASTPVYGLGRGGLPHGGGRGFARGGGRGRCRTFFRSDVVSAPPYDETQERESLRQDAQYLQAQLERIQARLSELTRPTDAQKHS